MARKRKLPMVPDSRKTAMLQAIEAKHEELRPGWRDTAPLTREEEQQVRAKLPTFNRDIFQFGRSVSGKARAQVKTSRRINKR